MHRRLPIAAALLLVIFAAAWLLLAARSTREGSRVYTVAGILDATHRDPEAWDGKVAWVRGAIQPGLVLVRFHSQSLTVATGSATSIYVPPSVALAGISPGYLPLSDSARGQAVLWVDFGHYGGLMAALHRLPLVGGLVPSPRPLQVGEVTTYRVRLHAVRAPCPSPGCVVGTLLDYTSPARAPDDPTLDPLNHAVP